MEKNPTNFTYENQIFLNFKGEKKYYKGKKKPENRKCNYFKFARRIPNNEISFKWLND